MMEIKKCRLVVSAEISSGGEYNKTQKLHSVNSCVFLREENGNHSQKNSEKDGLFRIPLTRRFAAPSPGGRGNDLRVVLLPPGEGGAKRRMRDFQDLQRQHARAVAEAFLLHTKLIQHAEKKIRHGRVLWSDDVSVAFERAACAAEKDESAAGS
jgi:hypothetical protein